MRSFTSWRPVRRELKELPKAVAEMMSDVSEFITEYMSILAQPLLDGGVTSSWESR